MLDLVATYLHVHVHVHVCMCACVHVHACVCRYMCARLGRHVLKGEQVETVAHGAVEVDVEQLEEDEPIVDAQGRDLDPHLG